MSLNLRLLLLLDSRSPAGGHGHSAGIEAAVNAGFVNDMNDLRTFALNRLKTVGLVSAAFSALAHRAYTEGLDAPGWHRLDAELDARTISPALRTASRSLGRGLRRLLASSDPDQTTDLAGRWIDCPRPSPHHPLVLGAAVAIVDGSALDAARAAANSAVSVPGSASLRLLGLDPYQVHALNHQLAGEVEAVAQRAAGSAVAVPSIADTAAQLPAESSPAMDVLAEFHLHQEVRLFAS
ncbi:MAG: hypothetical protein JWM76_2778 [Pseudonocardiales bacterium]|nr:hypothetical protein [Pseudonocardiales bacterium]